MLKVNVYQAKTHLSKLISRMKPGETLTICRRNLPVAELRALGGTQRGPRPVGLARRKFAVPASFFEPLPDELLDAFEGAAR